MVRFAADANPGRSLPCGFERFGRLPCPLGLLKKDWLNLAIGTLVNISVAATFAPTVAQDMFHKFTAAVQPLFDAILKLMQ